MQKAWFRPAASFGCVLFLGLSSCGSDEGDGGSGGSGATAGRGGGSSTGALPGFGGSPSGGKSGAAGASGAIGVSGSTSAGSSVGGAPSTGGTSAGGGPGAGSPCTVGSPPTCADTQTVLACIDGFIEQDNCGTLCTEWGFQGGSCDQGCVCGEPVDTTCLTGIAAFCTCFEADTGTPCTDDDSFIGYVACHVEEPTAAQVACYADFVTGMTVDCDAAALGCPAPP